MNLRSKKAAFFVNQGGVIAYPTETVWGLGCDPFNQDAVNRLLKIKQRRPEKGLILVAGSIEQVEPLLKNLKHRKKIIASWPGPVTWIIPGRGLIPQWITGKHETVAIRVSNHPVVQQLCLDVGHLLVSTSCNRAGKPVVSSAMQAHARFHQQLDYVLPGKVMKGTPSQIIDSETLVRLR